MGVFTDSEKFPFLPWGRVNALKSRPVQSAVLIIIFILLTISLYGLGRGREAGESRLDHYKERFSKSSGYKSKATEAKRLYAQELLERPLATDLTSIPKLLHQSWMNPTLPAKFEEWSHSCRQANPDWEWVLWTDEDNMKLVEKYAPWFASTYDALHSEIYRADTARNIYMHVFGGVYADLDTECVGPYEEMFAEYNTSMVVHNMPPSKSRPLDKSGQSMGMQPTKAHEEHRPKSTATGLDIPSSVEGERKVFLGRMGTDDDFVHSIPNAWMGSTPGHPFWVLPLESCEQHIGSTAQPEYLTGPPALYDRVKGYRDEYDHGRGEKMDDHYGKSGWRHLYKQPKDHQKLPPQSMVVLPFWEVYPYSWERDGEAYRNLCWVTQDTFSAATCKQVLGLDHWGSHSITYWSHSWSADGHWDAHMDALNKPSKTTDSEETGETTQVVRTHHASNPLRNLSIYEKGSTYTIFDADNQTHLFTIRFTSRSPPHMTVTRASNTNNINGSATYHRTKKFGLPTASTITFKLPSSGTVSLNKEGGFFSSDKRTPRSAVLGQVYRRGRQVNNPCKGGRAKTSFLRLVDTHGRMLVGYRDEGYMLKRLGFLEVGVELTQKELDDVVVSAMPMLSEEQTG